ncbi:hypothetical protein OC846_006280 [Tilletia horrida]|uniref:Uncharacterized protein n=1 Tax=Tilletia horrida TaxID=155126 RepID=A0AAN6JPH2_9BASI|nr:hypothetical protein OC846_006280 [Tilletia horrida]KAK0560771.1 hypothetical protein OC861_006136 [Tilletia horrida]
MSRISDASRRFDFDSRSLWHRHRYNTGSFHVMPASQVRAFAEQLLRAANGNESHPIIRRNAVYRACLRPYHSLP